VRTSIRKNSDRAIGRVVLPLVATIVMVVSPALAAKLSVDPTIRLIASVKRLPVSELDPILPSISFANWLEIEAGSGARISYAVRQQSNNAGNLGAFPTCVEADAQLEDGRAIWIFIAVRASKQAGAIRFKLHSATILTQHETIDVRRLSDVPAVLIKTHEVAAAAHPEIAQ